MEAKIFKIIGNVTRVKILACLGESEKTVTELISNCCLSQSAVSQHLAFLRDEGVIFSTKKGKYHIYKVADKRLSQICKDILELFPNLIKCN
ncbi:winged helix-turn-helix transcriptional regulator [Candidatus Dojkabacteria bacterium]|nr:winged helix-turn-helix transcriptional regulator [Candidatus Dojkabacteria bacterium]